MTDQLYTQTPPKHPRQACKKMGVSALGAYPPTVRDFGVLGAYEPNDHRFAIGINSDFKAAADSKRSDELNGGSNRLADDPATQ